jgi:deferrochelatase/peroxidase EfeB
MGWRANIPLRLIFMARAPCRTRWALDGHRGGNGAYQDSGAIMAKLPDGTTVPTAKENFGFTDGIGDPVFQGQYEPELEKSQVLGSGKISGTSHRWEALATGEFILGHASEAQELPTASPPWSFTRNGTFMACRKLHQKRAPSMATSPRRRCNSIISAGLPVFGKPTKP